MRRSAEDNWLSQCWLSEMATSLDFTQSEHLFWKQNANCFSNILFESTSRPRIVKHVRSCFLKRSTHFFILSRVSDSGVSPNSSHFTTIRRLISQSMRFHDIAWYFIDFHGLWLWSIPWHCMQLSCFSQLCSRVHFVLLHSFRFVCSHWPVWLWFIFLSDHFMSSRVAESWPYMWSNLFVRHLVSVPFIAFNISALESTWFALISFDGTGSYRMWYYCIISTHNLYIWLNYCIISTHKSSANGRPET
jgi:hypothetical protein